MANSNNINTDEIEVDANNLADTNGDDVLSNDEIVNHSSDVVSLEDIEDSPELSTIKQRKQAVHRDDDELTDQDAQDDENEGVVDYYSRRGVDPINSSEVDEDSTPSVGDAGHPGDDEDTT